MPMILKEEEAAIYMDTDMFFLRPPEHLWPLFAHFDHNDIFGAVKMSEYYLNSNIAVRKSLQSIL